MKSWFGVMGRSLLEFILVLASMAGIAGISANLASPAPGLASLVPAALASIPRLFPAAVAVLLFLAIYSFEHRVRSRLLGWAGLILLGVALCSSGLALRRLPFLRDAIAGLVQPPPPASPEFQAPGLGAERGGLLVWYRSAEGDIARDAVAVDYRSAFPRLRYSASAPLDPRTGSMEIGGLSLPATKPTPAAPPLLPELSLFQGSWVWDRLEAIDALSWPAALAVVAGFALLAGGFRFAARLTRWPLANALFGVAALIGFLVLDASLWSPAFAGAAAGLASGIGLGGLAPAYPLAGLEALAGLVLAGLDLALKPKGREARG